MAGLTILITNTILQGRTGTEIVTRDLALGLKRRGHRPIVYSPIHGDLARMLLAETIAVVDDPGKVAVRPDVIHGHHTFETSVAMLRFPDVPALFICHSWGAEYDMPPITSMVRRYLAVDETCRDRLTCREGIEPDRVRVLGNAVDLTRFPPRGPLPPSPRRAVVFSNEVYEGNVLPAIRAGCERAGLSLDLIGDRSGNFQTAPERVLHGYDIVFAKARCALEAMAVGAAVIACDIVGFAGLVTAANFDRLRALNFGFRALKESPVTAERVADAIARYDAADATLVHQKARRVADLEHWLDELITVYHEIKDDRPDVTDRDSMLAFARRLLVSTHEEVRKYHDIHRAATSLTEYSQLLERERDALTSARDSVMRERDARMRERDILAEQVHSGTRQHEALTNEFRQLQVDRDRLAEELRELRSSNTVRLGERLKRLIRRGPRAQAG